jgi:hypothetical protein
MKKSLFSTAAGLMLFFYLFSCSENVIETIDESKLTDKVSKKSLSSITNPWKDNPYKVNIVYFVPNDLDTIPDYKGRLSRIMLQLQEFYGKNLQNAGYGYTSFGLDLSSDTSVNILTVHGKNGKSSYPYSGGGSAVITELNEYFNLHPDQKKSSHTLIIMPSYYTDPLKPGGPPFYGMGRNCFALDYPGMDIDKLGIPGTEGYLATKWIGGLAHELGHGLNAPHNKELKGEHSTLGTALMGAGNSSYGKSATFLTKATAAIFSTSETFSTITRNDWYQGKNHRLSSIKAEVIDNKIILTGRYLSNAKVNSVSVYHDPFPAGANKDYDAVTWASAPINNSSFKIECPLDKFHTRNGDYEMRLTFIHENGNIVRYTYKYKFENEHPDIEKISNKDFIDRTHWEIVETDNEESGAAKNVLDFDPATTWHTRWRSPVKLLPHHFIVDMKSQHQIKGFGFMNRSNQTDCIKDIELFKSNDNINWASIGKYELILQKNWQYIDLPQQESMRYVKLKVTKNHASNQFVHLAEFAAY